MLYQTILPMKKLLQTLLFTLIAIVQGAMVKAQNLIPNGSSSKNYFFKIFNQI